jgi:GWxTD domain-containing protein
MKAKKYFQPVFLSLFLILLNFNLPAENEDKYEKWLNKEVNLIITEAEKAEFKKLEKERDKDFFIKLFWAKRDPNPQTEKNEFQDEYYRRLEYLKNAFLYGYKTGTETDMGKVYLYFGKPRVLHPSTSPSGLQKNSSQETRVVHPSTSPSDLQKNSPQEIWIYPSQPWMNLPKKTFIVVFTHDGIGYVIDQNQTDFRVRQALYSYPEKILLHPDLKELPFAKKPSLLPPESFGGKLIQQIKSSQEDIVQIPFEKQALFTKAENESTYLTFLLKIEPGEKKEAIQKKMVIFGSLERDGQSYDFRQEKELQEEENYLISQVGLPLLPGDYKLFIGLATMDEKSYSIKMDQIQVPDFWTQELALSSLLASAQVSEKEVADKKTEFDVFSLGRYALLPRFSHGYKRDESLNLFYYIYNVARDENQNCSLLIEIELQKGEKNFKLNPQRRQRKVGEEAAILEGTQIPLSALAERGEYELRVKVTDELTQKTASEKLKFSLL